MLIVQKATLSGLALSTMSPPVASITPPASSSSGPLPSLDTVVTPLTPSAYPSPHHTPIMAEPCLEPAMTPLALRIDHSRGKKRPMNEDSMTPTSPVNNTNDGRTIIPLKSGRRVKATPMTSPTLSPRPITIVIASRESSPVLPETAGSSPVKRPRTNSISGDITNFHILPSSDDESDDPMSSPTVRMRQRFNQLLGPSPLQKSFSSAAVPQLSLSSSPIPPLERAHTTPAPSAIESPMKLRTRTKLNKVDTVEDLGTEMNKVFMLSYGRGLGMGSTGGGRYRRGSSLKPREGGFGGELVKSENHNRQRIMEEDDSGDEMDLDHC